eukprot:COSAG05_NODE_1854_length_3955_cov_10.052127_2_plen_196_part_00
MRRSPRQVVRSPGGQGSDKCHEVAEQGDSTNRLTNPVHLVLPPQPTPTTKQPVMVASTRRRQQPPLVLLLQVTMGFLGGGPSSGVWAQCLCPGGSAPQLALPPCSGGPPTGSGCPAIPPGVTLPANATLPPNATLPINWTMPPTTAQPTQDPSNAVANAAGNNVSKSSASQAIVLSVSTRLLVLLPTQIWLLLLS